MPLTEAQELKLYELYEISYQNNIVFSAGGFPLSSGEVPPQPFFAQTSLKTKLTESIAAINASEAQTARVAEIIAKYDDMGNDPSTIDRSGYSFRYKQSLAELVRVLYTYTGIKVERSGGSNLIPIG
jgi:hypothetical protein